MPSAAKRLAIHARNRPDCRFWVSSREQGRQSWEPISLVDGDLCFQSGERVDLLRITAFAAAYPNGQIFDGIFTGLGAPAGTCFLDDEGVLDDCVIPLAEIHAGASVLRIVYGACDAFPDDPEHYSTSLTNVCGSPVWIESFSPAYITSILGIRRRLHTGRRYSAEEFSNWYGAPDARIDPGATVTDFNNWGATPIAWVYRCRLESGRRILAGGVLQTPVTR